jgi:hypothetical protein
MTFSPEKQPAIPSRDWPAVQMVKARPANTGPMSEKDKLAQKL